MSPTRLTEFVHGEKLPGLLPDQEFFIPIHGFVRLTDEEVAVVNHPALQRLANVNQLGHTVLVYRGATHRRLEHALGTLAVLEQMAVAVRENHQVHVKRGNAHGSSLGKGLSDRERRFARLAALLHDVGHLPIGHTLEDELGILQRHDEKERIAMVLHRTKWFGTDVQSLAQLIDDKYDRFVDDRDGAASPSDIVLQLLCKQSSEPEIVGDIRMAVCRDMVGNTICADLLDYLYRDWYHIGKPKYFDRRIFQYMEIRKDGDRDRFVISLGFKPRIRSDAISSILSLLESRYELAESVLFHRTKCAAAAMLDRAIQEIVTKIDRENQRDWIKDITEKLLEVSDEAALGLFLTIAKDVDATAAVDVLTKLRTRILFNTIVTRFAKDCADDDRSRLHRLYSHDEEASDNRRRAALLLEQDLDLPVGSVAIYCPDKAMNHKIAGVLIHVDDEVAKLNDYDDGRHTKLAGGHLGAQIARFNSLWRIHVCVDESAWNQLSRECQIFGIELIERLILGDLPAGVTAEEMADTLAGRAIALKGNPFYEMPASQPPLAAESRTAIPRYPCGAPAIHHFFR